MTDRTRSWSCLPWSGLRALLLVLALFAGVSLTARPAEAKAAAAAAATANQGLNACSSNTGKALYDCVGGVMDRLSSDLASAGFTQTARSIQSAAAGLHRAINKLQALSAIAQCRAAVAGALRQVNASAARFVEGVGGTGLNAVAAVLARAAQMIQSKG
jgi:hypothetical protein